MLIAYRADPGSRGRGLDPSFISAFVVIGYGVKTFTVSELIEKNLLNYLNDRMGFKNLILLISGLRPSLSNLIKIFPNDHNEAFKLMKK